MHYIAKIDGKRMWENSDDVQKVIEDLRSNKDIITGIELSSNSLGFEAAKALAIEIKNLHNLEVVIYRDIFVSRKKEDLPKSLFELINAIQDKKIRVLDLSDNAFGPIGVESFGFFLKNTSTLKELYIENNGLGPEGAEMVANNLLENDQLNLQVLVINRNRLENKGAVALSRVFRKMQTLKHIQLYQNGIKEEGMGELINSLLYNSELTFLKMNDNLIKNSGTILAEVIPSLKNLKSIDISDSLLGHENSLNLFKSLSNLNLIEEIYCNYNEIEKKSTQEKIFDICLSINSLKVVELKGNDINSSLWKKFKNHLKNKIHRFEPYSDEEEAFDEEEEELIEEVEQKLVLNK